MLFMNTNKMVDKYDILANEYRSQNNLIEAERCYLQSISNGNNGAYVDLGIMYEEHNLNKAEKYYNSAKKCKVKRVYLCLGLFYYNYRKNYNEALKNLLYYCDNYELTAEELYKDNQCVYYIIGKIYENYIIDVDKSIEYYLKAVDNNDVESYYDLSRLYLKTDDYDNCEKYLLMSLKFNNIQTYILLSNVYCNRSRYGDALRCLNNYLKINGDNYKIFIEIGDIYCMYLKVINVAEEYYLNALQLKPDDRAVNIYIGKFYDDQSNYKLALKYYLRGIRDQIDIEKFHELYLNIGLIYLNSESDIDNAIKYFLISSKFGNICAPYRLSLLYYDKKEIMNSFKFANIGLNRNNPECNYTLGILYLFEYNKPKLAYDHFLKCEELNICTKSLCFIGYYYEIIMRDYDKAEEYYLKYLKTDHNESQNIWGILANLYVVLKYDYSKALDYCNKLIECNDGYELIIQLFIKNNEYAKAIDYCNQFIKDNPFDGYIILGDLYRETGRDGSEIISCYNSAYKAGNKHGYISIAIYYLEEKNDYKEAEKYLRKVQEFNSDAYIYIGKIYEKYKADYKLAEKNYLMAFKKGSTKVINHLYFFYKDIKKDEKKAQLYYKIEQKENLHKLI